MKASQTIVDNLARQGGEAIFGYVSAAPAMAGHDELLEYGSEIIRPYNRAIEAGWPALADHITFRAKECLRP